MTPIITKTLYEQDLNLWLEETAARLKARDIEGLDFDHLIEEIEGLAGRDRKEIRSRLRVLLAHILKRCYVTMPDCYRGWTDTISDQRSELEILLEQSPSLKQNFVDIFDDSFKYALKRVRGDYPRYQFPDTWQFSREVGAILSEEFWQ